MTFWTGNCLRLLVCLVVASTPALAAAEEEILYSSKEFAKLDTFEAASVEDADRLFGRKDYTGAYAAYKAYTVEFPSGRALPYALLRMGRCLHLADKRNTAVKAYQDVVDYFPNNVRYAAAAMYYIGECHRQSGDEDKALAIWAKMVKDDQYVNEPRSGTALVALSNAMNKRGDFEQATTFRWRAAVAFAKSNPAASQQAREQVVRHYVVRSPNQEKLLAFCNEVGGFGWRQTIDKPDQSATYWQHVLDIALSAPAEDNRRADVCRYWDAQMGDRFADNDALRVTWFNVRLAADNDSAAWAGRMDEQFARKPPTIERVRQWLGYFDRFPKAQVAFFEKHAKPLVQALDSAQKIALARHLNHPLRMTEQAHDVLRTVKTDGMSDAELATFASLVAEYEGEEAFLRTVARIKNQTYAARARFDFYFGRARHNRDFQDKALAEIPALKQSTDDAQAIVWNHATLLDWRGDFEAAIKLYQAANRQPQSTWAIIDCHVALKQYDKAIQLTRELESVGNETASAACLKAADIYRISGDKAKEVQQLQLVLRRYPKSGQSSTAHQRLESYGVKLIGAEGKAEE